MGLRTERPAVAWASPKSNTVWRLALLLIVSSLAAQASAQCSLASCSPAPTSTGCAFPGACGLSLVSNETFCPARLCSGAPSACTDARCSCAQTAWLLPPGSPSAANGGFVPTTRGALRLVTYTSFYAPGPSHHRRRRLMHGDPLAALPAAQAQEAGGAALRASASLADGGKAAVGRSLLQSAAAAAAMQANLQQQGGALGGFFKVYASYAQLPAVAASDISLGASVSLGALCISCRKNDPALGVAATSKVMLSVTRHASANCFNLKLTIQAAGSGIGLTSLALWAGEGAPGSDPVRYNPAGWASSVQSGQLASGVYVVKRNKVCDSNGDGFFHLALHALAYTCRPTTACTYMCATWASYSRGASAAACEGLADTMNAFSATYGVPLAAPWACTGVRSASSVEACTQLAGDAAVPALIAAAKAHPGAFTSALPLAFAWQGSGVKICASDGLTISSAPLTSTCKASFKTRSLCPALR